MAWRALLPVHVQLMGLSFADHLLTLPLLLWCESWNHCNLFYHRLIAFLSVGRNTLTIFIDVDLLHTRPGAGLTDTLSQYKSDVHPVAEGRHPRHPLYLVNSLLQRSSDVGHLWASSPDVLLHGNRTRAFQVLSPACYHQFFFFFS